MGVIEDRGRRVTKIEFEPGRDPGPERALPNNRVTRYALDSRDRLREVLLPDGRKVRYQHNAFGRRIRKKVIPAKRDNFAAMLVLATKDGVDALPPIERTTFIWDGDVICQELKSPNAGGGDGVKTYVHEPGTFVPMLHEKQGAVFTYVVDHLGTPRELIDRDGRVAWAGSFSAWGREAEEYRDPKCRWRVEVPWRLLGQYADAETGLCSTRFRYFDGEAGRWLSPDPLGLAGGKNLHGFDGAPTVEVDPWGLQCEIHRLDKRGRVLFEGMEVRGVRNLAHESTGRLRAMAEHGFAANDHLGRPLQLHHMEQNPEGPLVEIPIDNHKGSNRRQHPFGNVKGAGLTKEERSEFNTYRENYSRARAREELKARGEW